LVFIWRESCSPFSDLFILDQKAILGIAVN
jgi:hypothetical protein